MKQKLSFKEYIYVASMLFGMFFGAGNLIFPVYMAFLRLSIEITEKIEYNTSAHFSKQESIQGISNLSGHSLENASGPYGYDIFHRPILYPTYPDSTCS